MTADRAQVDTDAVDFIRRLVGAWDCCGTCAGGLLAEHDRQRNAALLAEVESIRAKVADAYDEGAKAASPYGGAYLRSFYAQNPYRDALQDPA